MNPLIRRVGRVRAFQFLLGVEPLATKTLLEYGLIDQLCKEGQALESALELARKLTALPVEAIEACKRFLSKEIHDDALADKDSLEAFMNNCSSPISEQTFAKFRPKI